MFLSESYFKRIWGRENVIFTLLVSCGHCIDLKSSSQYREQIFKVFGIFKMQVLIWRLLNLKKKKKKSQKSTVKRPSWAIIKEESSCYCSLQVNMEDSFIWRKAHSLAHTFPVARSLSPALPSSIHLLKYLRGCGQTMWLRKTMSKDLFTFPLWRVIMG